MWLGMAWLAFGVPASVSTGEDSYCEAARSENFFCLVAGSECVCRCDFMREIRSRRPARPFHMLLFSGWVTKLAKEPCRLWGTPCCVARESVCVCVRVRKRERLRIMQHARRMGEIPLPTTQANGGGGGGREGPVLMQSKEKEGAPPTHLRAVNPVWWDSMLTLLSTLLRLSSCHSSRPRFQAGTRPPSLDFCRGVKGHQARGDQPPRRIIAHSHSPRSRTVLTKKKITPMLAVPKWSQLTAS